MSFNFHVRGTVPALEQPSGLSCWATVGTMLLSWKERMSMTIGDAMARVGEPYVSYFRNNRVLPWSEHDDFARAMGMTIDGPQCYSIHGLLDLLSTTGSPLFVVIAPGASTGTTHIVAVTGMSGDGSPDGTTIYFNDPAGGRRRSLTFRQFTAEYEGAAIRQGLTAHVMHY